jgi:hypothetical protein
MNQKALSFIGHSSSEGNFNFLVEKAKIPEKYLYASRAMIYEYRFMYETALKEW